MNTEDYETIEDVYNVIKKLESIQGCSIEVKEGPTSLQYSNEEIPKIVVITIEDGADCSSLFFLIEEHLRKEKRRQIAEQSKFSHEKFNQLKK